MATKDTASDKLVASIRKSKTGASAPKTENAAPVKAPAKDAPAKKAPARKAPAVKKKAAPAKRKTAAKPAAKSSAKSSEGGFQHGRRVWPD